jgi:2-C-methyl-D-erythritol 4-phosphate cytidylyltransferase
LWYIHVCFINLEPKVLKPKVCAILLMGGRGDRFGSSRPKQFHALSGKRIYVHTLETFLESQLFAEIVLVCVEEWIPAVREELQKYGQTIKIVPAGETRQLSSYRGICACSSDISHVVIHDAVRPFVSAKILRENIQAALTYGAANTCLSSADTIVHTKDGREVHTIPRRIEYMRGQTPQSFERALVQGAHEHAQKLGLQDVSDDCRLVLELGHKVHIVEGDERNIKITTELDLFIAEQLLRTGKTTALDTKTSSLFGKRYAVVGGTGGIGKAIVNQLEKEGALPLVISKSAPNYPADCTNYSNVENLFHAISEEHGALDGIINALGVLEVKEFSQLAAHEIEKTIASNLTSVIFCCRCATIKEGGHLINIASSAYFRGRKDYAVYSATKAAVVNFTQALAEEFPKIYVNAVVPSRTSTAMRHQNFPDEDPATLLSPDKVAAAIIQLLKQEHITGSIIEVKKLEHLASEQTSKQVT